MKNDLSARVKRACRGDKDAFSELYEKYALDMYKFALYYTGNTVDAEDAVQEAAVKAYTSIGQLRDPSAFKTWLFKILSNVCKSRLTSREAKTVFVSVDDDDLKDEPSAENNALSYELYDALNTLGDDERQIVIFSVVQKYKSNEIAEIMNCPASTVRSKLARSLSKLKVILS